jgi:hypothetical protein
MAISPTATTSTTATKLTGYTVVLRIVNYFAAMHVYGSNKAFISKHPETDLKVAKATAQKFAALNDIPYDVDLRDLDGPFLTIIKNGEKWYPAEIYSDRLRLLVSFGPLQLGGTQSEAINMAEVIALSRSTDCIPSIGISIYESSLRDGS